jgi:uncharacterized protein
MVARYTKMREPCVVWPRAVGTIIRLSVALALACGGGAMAAAPDDLYRAQAIVTGQGEANRLFGFGACLEDVLIKVSGAQGIAGSRHLAAYKANAKSLVRVFDYHDQMSGKPKRDEQGTRDRPYDLIVDFDARKIHDALGALGLKPWLSHRPALAMFVEMEQGSREFVIMADAEQSALQRESLQAAAVKRGMPVLLPSSTALAKAGIKGAELGTMPSSALSPLLSELGGEVALIGRLAWDDSELGWATQWRLDWHGRTHRWQVRVTTFDEAFRRGIGGAAQILSGNGDPA